MYVTVNELMRHILDGSWQPGLGGEPGTVDGKSFLIITRGDGDEVYDDVDDTHEVIQ